ncbi:hypothetical protein CEUSTIGMA_g10817.t1 [Chlamydomonas eustigma]|uniref:Rieske domain-containing protein n=1 Tax=Chlamydomonas eustigma TaxID=1157962 RepID=A0A250XKE0_9CHLO|nr:hypothetical protein CEUSTIGMA_g10817.t1 [Chlamydomonas eustigma]|eukprot:GAX83392.1 hypothetical protein CEUSTIGMA_g10817.t1 [Chlamydomonas eustigma]
MEPVDDAKSADPRHLVGTSNSLAEGGRIHAKIEGRYVSVLRLNGNLHAIDSICFHAGGPLGIGEIEDLNGKNCIICPWHHYKIDIETGEKYYQAGVWENGKMKPGAWQSNGVKQRVHSTIEENGNIYVTFSKGTLVDSDGYAYNVPCGERMKSAGDTNQARSQQAVGGDGRMPSGYVLRNNAAAAAQGYNVSGLYK